MSDMVETQAPAAADTTGVKGMRKNGMASGCIFRQGTYSPAAGKQWHDNKPAFRPRANQTSWDKRTAERKALAATKVKEKELKEEKEAARQVGA